MRVSCCVVGGGLRLDVEISGRGSSKPMRPCLVWVAISRLQPLGPAAPGLACLLLGAWWLREADVFSS